MPPYLKNYATEISYILLPPGAEQKSGDSFLSQFLGLTFLASFVTIESEIFRRGACTFAFAFVAEETDVEILKQRRNVSALADRAVHSILESRLDFSRVNDILQQFNGAPVELPVQIKTAIVERHQTLLRLSLLAGLRVAVYTSVSPDLESLEDLTFDLQIIQRLSCLRDARPMYYGLAGVYHLKQLCQKRLAFDLVKTGTLALVADPSILRPEIFDLVLVAAAAKNTAIFAQKYRQHSQSVFCSAQCYKVVGVFAKERQRAYIQNSLEENNALYNAALGQGQSSVARKTLKAFQQLWLEGGI